MSTFKTFIQSSERVFPNKARDKEQTIALSLLDATVTNFAKACVIWLLERPTQPTENFNLAVHLRRCLRITLNAYPQWCGQLKSITSIDHLSEEESSLPPHARRFGRVYVTYGSLLDPGVAFIIATSTATLDDLSPINRTSSQPIWDRHTVPLGNFVPATLIIDPLRNPINSDGDALPTMAIQITTLACGGFALSVKMAHAIADAHSLIHFVTDWASVSRSMLLGTPLPSLHPVFEPSRLDSLAAGNINGDTADECIRKLTEKLPFNRYDWWIPSPGMPSWGASKPEALTDEEEVIPAGKAMPWSEFDGDAPVSHYIFHLTHDQVNFLWRGANKGSSANEANKEIGISQHDAILAHIWACINRARKMGQDDGPVHASLSYGLRPVLNLGDAFMGSPIVILNLEMSGREITDTTTTTETGQLTNNLEPIARRIRETIHQASNASLLAAHLHSVAFEKTPQRIWQAFLGRRHLIVTTWARAGLYEIDFGFGEQSRVRYADGVVPDMDGIVLIKEAPPLGVSGSGSGSGKGWTENGVDIFVQIRTEDMHRLIRDPLLLPDLGKST